MSGPPILRRLAIGSRPAGAVHRHCRAGNPGRCPPHLVSHSSGRGRWLLFGLVLGSLLLPAAGRTDEPGASSRIDQALQAELQQERPKATSPPSSRMTDPSTPAVSAIPEAMESAAEQIRAHRLQAAIAQQTAVLAALDQLLQDIPQASDVPEQSPSEGGNIAGIGEGRPDEPGRRTGRGDGVARESSPDSSSARPGVVPLERRRNLATSVWGHLPDRMRDQMQSSYQERFLPGYEDLVEQYYESLAEQRSGRD